MHVDTANDVVYELVAKLVQEQVAEEQRGEEATEQAPKDVANPADLQGKPRSMTHNLKLCNVLNYVFGH